MVGGEHVCSQSLSNVPDGKTASLPSKESSTLVLCIDAAGAGLICISAFYHSLPVRPCASVRSMDAAVGMFFRAAVGMFFCGEDDAPNPIDGCTKAHLRGNANVLVQMEGFMKGLSERIVFMNDSSEFGAYFSAAKKEAFFMNMGASYSVVQDLYSSAQSCFANASLGGFEALTLTVADEQLVLYKQAVLRRDSLLIVMKEDQIELEKIEADFAKLTSELSYGKFLLNNFVCYMYVWSADVSASLRSACALSLPINKSTR